MVNEMAFTTRSAKETFRLGRQLGSLMKAGDVVFLTGDLGAGKTTFAKGIALGLGVREEVTSPTFTLVAEYEGRVPLAHMDLYRLLPEPKQHLEVAKGQSVTSQVDEGATSAGEEVGHNHGEDTTESQDEALQIDFAAIGIGDYLYGDYAVLVEWPGVLVNEVDDALHVHIVQQPLPKIDEREFRCKATGDGSWKLLDEWVKQWLF